MRKFLVIIEKGKDGYGAYSPDLPGCVAVGATQKETEKKIYEAISFGGSSFGRAAGSKVTQRRKACSSS
jgi:hypothetical protein